MKGNEATTAVTPIAGTSDSHGNTYAAGSIAGTGAAGSATFGGTTITQSAEGKSTAFVAKYDAAGDFAWAKGIESSGTGGGVTSVKADASGVYISGYFADKLDIGQDGSYEQAPSVTGSLTGYIAKLDPNGAYLWSISITSTDAGSTASRLALDANGNVYLTGYYYSYENDVIVNGTHGTSAVLTKGESRDFYAMKVDTDGRIIWSTVGKGYIGDNTPSGIAVSPSGEVYVVGTALGLTFGGVTYGNAAVGGFILKLDATGEFQWFKKMMGAAADKVFQIAVDSQGNPVMVGLFSGTTFDIDPGAEVTAISADHTDGYVAKLDPNANLLWYKQVKGAEGGVGLFNRVFIDPQDNVYASGTVDAAGTHSLDGIPLSGNGISEPFVWKGNSAGSTAWLKSVGGPGYDQFVDIEIAPNDGIRAILRIGDTADVDPGPSVLNAYTSAVNKNALVITNWSASGELAPFAAAAPAYQINGMDYSWQDAVLAADGDRLAITTDGSPSAPVRIHVTAPQGSTVTLQGKPGNTYTGVYVQADEHITLNLEDFNITAPAGDSFSGISFTKTNSTGNTVLNLTGSNTIQGFEGIRAAFNHQLTITGTGSLITKGRPAVAEGADSGHGIHLLSDGTGATQPGSKLIIEAAVTAIGGDSTAESGGNGIFLDWGNMLVKSGVVTAKGGNTDGDRTGLSSGSVTRRGGRGIQLVGWGFPQSSSGILTVEGGQVTAAGGEALAVNPNGYFFEGGKGIDADTGVSITGGTVTAAGGSSVNGIGGHAIQSWNTLDISGANTAVTAMGGKGITFYGSGIGLYITNNISISGAVVTATGGEGSTSEYGIFSPNGSLTISNGAHVTANGGQGIITDAGASGGPAVYVSGTIHITGSDVSATGGDGPVNGSHGLISINGEIVIEDGASVEAFGGTGTTGVGGAGLRAFGNGTGSKVLIAADAGDVYVRGGQGASAVRPSVIGKDVFIAAGNVGQIAMEGSVNPRSIKNTVGGDDVYMLSASKNPPAAGAIVSQVTGVLGGAYTYHAPTKADGTAFLWLPAGNQTAASTGYTSENPTVTPDDSASVVLSVGSSAPELGLSQWGNYDFGTATAGYVAPAALSVTVSNTGTGSTGALTVALSGTNASDFILSKTAVSDLAAGGSDSFTVVPKAGLLAGLYTATVTVSGDSVTAQSFTVSFEVTPALSNDAGLTGIAGQTAAAVGGGDGSTADQAITWTVNVPYSTTSLGLSDVSTVTGVTYYKLYTDNAFTSEITGASTVDLTAGGATAIYVKVMAQDGVTVKYYAVTVNREEDLTYGIGLSQTGNQDFGTATAGYVSPAAYSVTVNNTGTGSTGALTVALSGTNASDFILSKTAVSGLAAGGSDSFTVVPKTGLPAGQYTATVTVSGDSVTAQSFTVSFTVSSALNNDAVLTGIAGQTAATPGGGNGSTANQAVTWTVNVPYSTAALRLTDVTTVTGATYQMYTDSGFTSEITGSSTVALTAGGATTVYVKVTAQDGVTVKYFAVIVNRAADSTPTSTDTSQPAGTPDNGVDVYVNGKAESAGTATVKQINDQTVTTIDVNQQKLEGKLAAEGKNAVVTVMFTKQSDVLVGQLNGEMIAKMEQQQASLELKTNTASYKVPSLQLNIQGLAEKLGAGELKDVKLQIHIAETGSDKLKIVSDAAAAGGFTVVAPSVDFTVNAVYGDKTIEIKDYSVYVERRIAIPEGINSNKITTGVVVEADGTVRHVPTRVEVVDGKYYAVINSLTNSTYSVVYHPLEFADAAGHWGKSAINDMGSRMVIEGVGADRFEPERDITRAEFAAILVKGLGLRLNAYQSAPFSDVARTDWYAQVVQTAYDYKLIAGYEDGSFRPEVKITRQEAMNIMAKAMRITGLKNKLQGTADVLAGYQDQTAIASWAYEAAADCVAGGLISGRSAESIAPVANITRAEVAAIVQRLLKKSELI
ncbi:S-layer homology domain-containing protein [Paenibacillus mesotrionivorans]|uniref:S-layer homology domain-containing protein n=1 Tax=Paenibacillus mesotrionivorans TaxID=3160968 RepID=A0ACC7NTF0_9BACL